MWLIKNMYSIEKVPTKHFKIMKKYVATMKGHSRDKVLQEALALIEHPENVEFDTLEQILLNEAQDKDEREELKKKIVNSKVKRAEAIAKALSPE